MTFSSEPRFIGKVVLVTGGTSGIGRAAAEAFADEGATVVISGRRAAEGEAIVQANRATSGTIVFIEADLGVERDIDALFDKVLDRFGRIDIGFNNAGVEGDLGVPMIEYEDAMFRDLLNINLVAVFRCMKRELEAMSFQGGGVILNTISAAGLRAYPNLAGYTASKWGLVGITQAAALEYAGANIRVNGICPGVVATEMADRAYIRNGIFSPRIIEAHPLGRIGTTFDVTAAVLWLSSSQASFITGAMLPIDGGAALK